VTPGDELGDDRRDECRDCGCEECQDMRRADETFRRPWGPGYVGALGAVSDAVLTADALDRAVPLGERWPEPRIVDQDVVVHLWDRTAVYLSVLGPDDAARLLEHVLGLAAELHEAAVCDEELTTSTALRWAMEQAAVPAVADLDPIVWLEASVLVRALRARSGGPRSDGEGSTVRGADSDGHGPSGDGGRAGPR
jgi:hypothetical protein